MAWRRSLTTFLALAVLCGCVAGEMPACPMCGMTADESAFYEFMHGQRVYFCSMAHDFKSDPTVWMSGVSSEPPAQVYGNATKCPVCGMTVDPTAATVHRAVVKNGQSVYACSATHALAVYENPALYAADEPGAPTNEPSEPPPQTPYCTGSTVMFNGFTFSGGGTCVRFLFEGWDLDTSSKLGVGIVGTFAMALAAEFCLFARRRIIANRALRLTRPVSRRRLAATTNAVDDDDAKSSLLNTASASALASTAAAAAPTSVFVVSTLLSGCAVVLGYFLMLLAMTYHAALFIAIVTGLIVGQASFRLQDDLAPALVEDNCC